MTQKRKRTASVPPKGLLPGEQLKRNILPSPGSSFSEPWRWVGSEVFDAADITLEHRLAACNLSLKNKNLSCRNKFAIQEVDSKVHSPEQKSSLSHVNGELDDDVIIISDDDEPTCSKKGCKSNPYCLNYLGQDDWEAENAAKKVFIKAAKLGSDPLHLSREPGLPVGLKNLGATCYANASLQVWYRDLAFRSGVYSCEPPPDVPDEKYKDSPIFQLQVTFAALQEGNQSVFNPAKLVESLQLRTTEQQDAQEFSKLFMSHLDAEFKKQSSPVLKSLITNQFQGIQVYGTICHSCNYRSERKSDFLEVEVSFKSNAKLEDCIAASLEPETLSGDNQYFCSGCESLQDASRYTELRELPPVLHFSLLRFVYDLKTMERKKSKNSISFPPILDMQKFLGSKQDRDNTAPTTGDDNLYELRGVLLHKGASAYHGHYEAQVNDVENGSWFLFNDEAVTKIKSLGDRAPLKRSSSDDVEEIEVKIDTSEVRKKRANARKRTRIEDSDDEVVEVKRKVSPKPSERPNLITSKDAYMLIYAKKDVHHGRESNGDSRASFKTPCWPTPSPRAFEVVEKSNHAHDTACRVYRESEKATQSRFEELKGTLKSIYSIWSTGPSEDTVVVGRQTLEAWLSTDCIEAALKQDGSNSSSETLHSDSTLLGGGEVTASNSQITCEHGLLDPVKSKEMKCITQDSYDRIVKETGCVFGPVLKPSDACVECVSNTFREKLYEIEHPRFTKQFDEVSPVGDDETGFWISKKWCRDWRLIKPRMHVPCEGDPSPDSSEFHNHVYCEHDQLSLNTTNRRKISPEAVTLLQKLFPSWKPLPTNAESCAVCDAEIHISKEDKKEIRRRIEEEKARLRCIYEPSLDAWAHRTESSPYAIIPSKFIKNWKRWLNNPAENARPEAVDNAPFFCQHGSLLIDPNCSADLHSSVTIIQRQDWDALSTLYEAGPLIGLSRNEGSGEASYSPDIPVCEGCRMQRLTEWDTAEIVLRLCGTRGTLESSSTQKQPATYGRTSGGRQSKRLRQIKEYGQRRTITVFKTSSVKDIKIMVHEEFSIPTICQRLFYRERELDDNSATVGSLQLLANAILDLREVEEVVDLDSDDDEPPTRKKRREEGPGFGGTLLGKTDACRSSSPEQTPHPEEKEKTCPACTFSNTFDASSCEICNTELHN